MGDLGIEAPEADIEAPEADAAEQRREAFPDPAGGGTITPPADGTPLEADEADAADQERQLGTGDDEYPDQAV